MSTLSRHRRFGYRSERVFSCLLLVLVLTAGSLLVAQQSEESPPSDFGLLGARHPAEGVLFGGQPDAGQLEAIARGGYATVLDLRGEGEARGYEEAELARSLGLEYQNIPISSTTLQDPATFTAFFEAFEEAERPVVVHCGSGNRVGALYYAYLVAKEGMDRSEALTEARKQGLRSQALVEAVDAYLDR